MVTYTAPLSSSVRLELRPSQLSRQKNVYGLRVSFCASQNVFLFLFIGKPNKLRDLALFGII